LMAVIGIEPREPMISKSVVGIIASISRETC
jgi:hypothetical protein